MRNKFSLKIHDWEEYIFILLFIVAVLPLFLLSFYNHPCNDDYGNSYQDITLGFLKSQVFWYKSWQGRYFDNLLIYFNPLVFRIYWAYKLHVVWLLLLTFVSLTWFLKVVFKGSGAFFRITILSVFGFAFYLRMPDISQGLMWQEGGYCYYIPSIITFLLLGSVISFYQTNKRIYIVFAILSAAAIIGTNEIHLIFTDILSFFLFIYFLNKKERNIPAILLLISCFIFSCIEVFAPGNFARSNAFKNNLEIMSSVVNSIKYGLFDLAHWLPFIVPVMVLLFHILMKKLYVTDTFYKLFKINPLFPLLFALVIPMIGPFLIFLAEGMPPALRSVDPTYFYFLSTLIYFTVTLVYYLKSNNKTVILPSYVRIFALAIVIFLSFFRTNNITNAYSDLLTGTAKKFNDEMTKRYVTITSSGNDTCTIEAIKNIPKTLEFDELPIDTTDWRYQVFCKYYNKKHIILKN